MEISGTTPALKSGSNTPNASAGAGTVGQFLYDVQEMIGSSKLQTPEDKSKSKFDITITKNVSTSTVDVKVKAN